MRGAPGGVLRELRYGMHSLTLGSRPPYLKSDSSADTDQVQPSARIISKWDVEPDALDYVKHSVRAKIPIASARGA